MIPTLVVSHIEKKIIKQNPQSFGGFYAKKMCSHNSLRINLHVIPFLSTDAWLYS